MFAVAPRVRKKPTLASSLLDDKPKSTEYRSAFYIYSIYSPYNSAI
jgi:hypothetical protein